MYNLLLSSCFLLLFSTTNSQDIPQNIRGSNDCIVSSWESWQPCINGTAIRYRSIIQPAINNGTQCQSLNETRPCPVSCQVSSWSSWSPCINRTRTRYRNITRNALNNGTECPQLNETQTCPVCTFINGTKICPINCLVTGWSRWSECINSSQFRTRLIVKNPEYNGTECPPLIQFVPCTTLCNVTKWSPWSQCMNGTKIRNRNLTELPNGNCSQPDLTEIINCTQNCIVSEWSDWSTCNNGITTTTRQILQYPTLGGDPCPPLINTHTCSDGSDNSNGYSKQVVLGLSLGLGIPLFICLDILIALLIIKWLKKKKTTY